MSDRKVPPNPDKPALPRRIERKLAEADEKSARAYDELESALAQLAEDGAPAAELDITDSLVHKVLQPGGSNDDPEPGKGA